MAFFIPSSIQKRLLRYALSRLELLETDALDLDSLDIGWGRKSTVELRDLQLRKQKLASLLQLPEQIRVDAARVALVRLTVPSNLYTSPIVVDIEGVEVKALLAESDVTKSGSARRTPRRRPSKAQSSEHDDDDGLPTTQDLATSFLAQEPLEEKEELQAQVQAQSVELHQSAVSTGTSDDDLASGTGIGLALPSFLADFLKGISDRLQVNIRKVAIYSEVDLPLPGSSSLQAAHGTVTLALRMSSITVKEAGKDGSQPPETPPISSTSGTSANTQNFQHAGRAITLHNLEAVYLTDKDFLSKLGPLTEQSPTIKPFSSPAQSWSKPGSPVVSAGSPAQTFRSVSSLSRAEDATEPLARSTASLGNQFEDASGDQAQVSSDSLFGEDSQHGYQSIYERSSLGALDSSRITEARSEYHEDDEDDNFPFAGTLEDSLRMLRSERGPSRSSIYYSRSSMPVSLRSESRGSTPEASRVLKEPLQKSYRSDSSFRSSNSNIVPGAARVPIDTDAAASPAEPTEDLTESRVYTSQEAESLYLSVAEAETGTRPEPTIKVPAQPHEEGNREVEPEIARQTSSEAHIDGASWKPKPTEEATADSSHFHIPGGWDDTEGTPILTGGKPPTRTPVAESGTHQENIDPDGSKPKESSSPDDTRGLRSVEASRPDGDASTSLAQQETPVEPDNRIETAIFHLDKTDIFIPDPTLPSSISDTAESIHETPIEQSTMLRSSIVPGPPGSFSTSFSTYASSTSRRQTLDLSRAQAREKDQVKQDTQVPIEPRISIGKVSCRANITTCRVLLQLVRRIQVLFGPDSDVRDNRRDRGEKSKSPNDALAVKFVLKLQSLVVEIADPSIPSLSRTRSDLSTKSESTKGLFVLQLENSSLKFSTSSGSQQVNLVLGTLLFDVAGERVISFSKDPQMTESIRDARATKDDISLAFVQTTEKTRLDVLTMPLRIDLDFHRIDDALSSLGGFSGLIELGNSIISESDVAQTPPMPSERPRAVRFDTGVKQAPSQPKPTSTTEVYCRIRGADLMLRGKTTTIRFQSTPIKIMARDALIGLQIDAMKATAPYLPGGPRPHLELNATNFRLTYLVHPEERDLSRLISLLTPSKDKFEEEDDFLLDTLLRQRKKGAAARVNFGNLDVSLLNLDIIQDLQDFAVELTKLSVAKYLPEESRPGLLILGNLGEVTVDIHGLPRVGDLKLKVTDAEFAQVGAPPLFAVGVHGLGLSKASGEPLIREVVASKAPNQPPMVMARLIGDELEPTLKIKLWNTAIEYSATLAETLMGYSPGQAHPNVAADLTASIATLTDRPPLPKADTFSSDDTQATNSPVKSMKFDLMLRDCGVGLTPRALPSKALLVFTQARVVSSLPKENDSLDAHVEIQKASLHLIDDTDKLLNAEALHSKATAGGSLSRNQLSDLSQIGFVNVFWLQAMTISLHLEKSLANDPDLLDLDTRDGLIVMETCADSQKTLTDLLGALSPVMPPVKGEKFRTEVASMDDMMASFTGDAFALGGRQSRKAEIDDSQVSFDDAHDVGDYMKDDFEADFDDAGEIPAAFNEEFDDPESQVLADSTASSQATEHQQHPVDLLGSSASVKSEIITGGLRPTQMPAKIHGFAKKWDSSNNRYVHLTASELSQSPIRIRVRDAHVIWNLYDGYDWAKTRDAISKAVYDIQTKAEERRSSRRAGLENEEDEPVIEDFLFNSIYIGIPVSHDPKELSNQINRNVDEMMTETGSHTSTTVTARPSSAPKALHPHGKKLRLNRSKRHKIAFELQGVSADVFIFQPGGETQNSIDVRVRDVEVFDHVPTSTWKKFATYMTDAGPREDKKPMLHLEICDVRPIPELIASELVLRVTVLPLRLHVDQDALDFITRFFEFKDDESSEPGAPPDQPYLQRVEVRPIPVKLDYKPKKVDYAGLRSGRTSEFMNFFVLDGAAFVLKHVILYGCAGFLKLHHSLEDVWMPDVKFNQLPTVLSGLNGVRTIVNVGQGVRDLVVIPIQEYQKDGRIVRSIAKGVSAFGRSTGGELTRFGAKLAVGAQNYLQGAEELLLRGARASESGWEDTDLDEEERRAISHYADQPAGILQGLKGAAKSLERDLLVAKDVIIAISGEIREAESAEGAARAIARNAPTLILRPMIGATKAISQTLMGATNAVDPENRKRVEDKYKRY